MGGVVEVREVAVQDQLVQARGVEVRGLLGHHHAGADLRRRDRPAGAEAGGDGL
jgi:hypothetical protein